jgi:cell filamentation protein
MADVYCYPDSSALKNKLDIHNKERLLTAETRLAAIRL